jgi:hypothetical protein
VVGSAIVTRLTDPVAVGAFVWKLTGAVRSVR